MKKIHFFLIVIFLHFIPKNVDATNYYFSGKGKDTNNGLSTSTPWKNISKVNNIHFHPGDSVLLQGGSSFSGYIWLQAEDSGNALHPVVFSTYGTGRANINAGNSFGLYAYNVSGFEIYNINFVGSGPWMNTSGGIIFYADSIGNIKFKHLKIQNVDVHGFGKEGITLGSYNKNTGFGDVFLDHLNVYDNKNAGILSYSESYLYRKAHLNFNITFCNVYNNRGDSTYLTNHTGDGIVIGGCTGVTISNCVAHDNGGQCYCKTAGPAGIWVYECDSAAIRYCESYHNQRKGGVDGDGFDLDIYTSNSVMEYNYSHDNEGVGYLLTSWTNDTTHQKNAIRYNVGQNNGDGILLYGPFFNEEIYNNTIYSAERNPIYGFKIDHGFWALNFGFPSNYSRNIFVRNNIFYMHGNVNAVEIDAKQTKGDSNVFFQGNVYYNDSGNLTYIQNNITYKSLSAWRNATVQEIIKTDTLGWEMNPLLKAAGKGLTIGNTTNLNSLIAYQIFDSSAIIGLGLNMDSILSITNVLDYFNDTLSLHSKFTPGAHEPQIKSIKTPLESINNFNEHFEIYPNPGFDILTLKGQNSNNQIVKIVNNLGQALFIKNFNGTINIPVSNLKSGLYFIEVDGKMVGKWMKL